MSTTSTAQQTPTIGHWVAGKPRPGRSKRHSEVTNPATGEVTARLALATTDEMGEAVTAAKAAFPGWRDASLTRRTQIMFAFRELLNASFERCQRGEVHAEARILPANFECGH